MTLEELDLVGARRVVVAMSGGVDSAVTAALVSRAGVETIGITLQLYDHGQAIGRSGACCAGQDIRDARRVADHLRIDHYVMDFEARFRSAVITDFAETYARGETPVPCVRCNQRVKFADLLEIARDLGADALATGHYVRRVLGPDGPELWQAAEPARDQSWFLFATTPAQLAFLRFPLGGLPKARTRALAHELGVAVAAKPDSQDICFVPAGRYSGLVERLAPAAGRPGEIVDLEGRVLGRHEGIARYTIGQRRGLGLGGRPEGAEPLYVVALDARRARVVVGPESALRRDVVRVAEVNWLGPPVPAEGCAVTVKLRSAQAPLPARWLMEPDGTARVLLDQPAGAVAPGQACVAYDGARVLGGGFIRAAERRAA